MTSLMLTVWQQKGGLRPTRAGQVLLEDPCCEAFGTAVVRLLGMVSEGATPFQIVAQVGHSSRALQLGKDWSPDLVTSELWAGYQGLKGVNG